MHLSFFLYDERHRHQLRAQLIHPRGQSSYLELQFQQNDLYLVQFNPSEPGEYKVEIMNNGKEITGSPFRLNAVAPDPALARKVTEKSGKQSVIFCVNFNNSILTFFS